MTPAWPVIEDLSDNFILIRDERIIEEFVREATEAHVRHSFQLYDLPLDFFLRPAEIGCIIAYSRPSGRAWIRNAELNCRVGHR